MAVSDTARCPRHRVPLNGGDAGTRDESALSEADHNMRVLAWDCPRDSTLLGEVPRTQAGGGRVQELQDEVAIPEVLRDFLLPIRSKLERLYDQAPPLVGEFERPDADETTLDMLDRRFEAQRGAEVDGRRQTPTGWD